MVAVENIVRKGEIAYNKKFLLFSKCFLPYMALIFSFLKHFKLLSAICFNLDQSKILSSVNALVYNKKTLIIRVFLNTFFVEKQI